jgi:hypothetical protein
LPTMWGERGQVTLVSHQGYYDAFICVHTDTIHPVTAIVERLCVCNVIDQDCPKCETVVSCRYRAVPFWPSY